MYWVISLVGALLVGALLTYLLAAVFGRGEDLPPTTANPWAEQHRAQLNENPITADTVGTVEFTQSLRGYNTEEVDRYLQRINATLREYENGQRGSSAYETRHDTTEEHTQ